VCLERGPLSLVSTIEGLLDRKSSGSGLENRDYGRRDPPCGPHDTPLSTDWLLVAVLTVQFVPHRKRTPSP
jgi:hypothetical protein